MEDHIKALRNMTESSGRIVFFGGAGVSTESGIPDFRSENGIYDAIRRFGERPETLLSHSFFMEHTERFFRYYRSALLVTDVQPNAAHLALAQLEREGKLTAVGTQNIDGLHTRAGSKNVYELHGSIYRNHCMNCGKFYSAEDIMDMDTVPRCSCGGVIKPDVVLYEEPLNEDTVEKSVEDIQNADMLIVAGTSLRVYPAAGLIRYYRGHRLVLLNREATPFDGYADLVIHDSLGNIFSQF